jgi:hypothetical protein
VGALNPDRQENMSIKEVVTKLHESFPPTGEEESWVQILSYLYSEASPRDTLRDLEEKLVGRT